MMVDFESVKMQEEILESRMRRLESSIAVDGYGKTIACIDCKHYRETDMLPICVKYHEHIADGYQGYIYGHNTSPMWAKDARVDGEKCGKHGLGFSNAGWLLRNLRRNPICLFLKLSPLIVIIQLSVMRYFDL